MQRTSYHICIELNDKIYTELIIDQHYKIKHKDISDDLILRLIMELNTFILTTSDVKNEFTYFTQEPVFLNNKPYRIILVTELNKDYIGVINTFRIKGKKYGISKQKRN